MNNVIDVELQELEEINVNLQDETHSDDMTMEIGTIMSGIDPDYEKLKNKPSINGTTLIGDKTTDQLGIALVGTYDNEHLTLMLS